MEHPEAQPTSTPDVTAPMAPVPNMSLPSTYDDQNESVDVAWDSILRPARLTLTKAQRAWDRRAQSPYSRRRLKIGKIWKRPNAHAPVVASGSVPSSTTHASPAKAVKKLCLHSKFGVGAQIRDWELRGSPNARRIVTRSIATEEGPDRLVALSDDETARSSEEQTNEAIAQLSDKRTVVEIIHEDGNVETSDDHHATTIDASEWLDVEQEGDDVLGWSDITTAHLGEDFSNHNDLTITTSTASDDGMLLHNSDVAEPETQEDLPHLPIRFDSVPVSKIRELTDEQSQTRNSPIAGSWSGTTLLQCSVPPVRGSLIPLGFVSPVMRRRRSFKDITLKSASRRRTLPVDFATATRIRGPRDCEGHLPYASRITIHQYEADASLHGAQVPVNEHSKSSKEESMIMSRVQSDHKVAEDDDWEDIVPSNGSAPFTSTSELAIENIIEEPETIFSTKESPDRSFEKSSVRRESNSPVGRTADELISAKQSPLVTVTPTKTTAHVFTEVQTDSEHCSMVTGSPSAHADSVSLGRRSSSAPPEDVHSFPQNPRQPRISDDTALLQAFLNRAAESRSSRHLSATARRESLENRRDSGSIRRALATPNSTSASTVTTVLKDLDPNSPSPRKSSYDHETVGALVGNKDNEAMYNRDVMPSPPTRGATARRSSRVKKKPETLAATTYASIPNRISIRGNAGPVVLKRTGAQELSLVTRNNTRKNRGGSDLPPIRLARLAKDALLDETPSDLDNVDRGHKTVQWAESLVTMHRYSPDTEGHRLHDDSVDDIAPLAQADPGGKDLVNSVNNSDTKTTQSTSGRVKSPRVSHANSHEDHDLDLITHDTSVFETEVAESEKPRPTKRRSRIATPAKVRGTPLLRPLEEELQSHMPFTAQTRAISKLPAPASVPLTTSGSGFSIGKEGSLIASPPKKRARLATTTSALPPLKPTSKLDFSESSFTFDAGRRVDIRDDTLSMGSPAKRSTGMLSLGSDGGLQPPANPQEARLATTTALGSPAKKRPRRTAR